MAHVPLLAHPDPRDALLICFGVGSTASAIAAHDSIERIDVIDLNDKVFETAPEFAASNGNVIEDPRVALIHDDGRSFLLRTDRRYDLVTSEPPPPRNEGVYRLYSREYYESVLEHLTPRGMMTQWLTVNQLSPEAVALTVSTFIDAFPHALLFVGHQEEFILLGSPAPIDLATLERRFGEVPAVRRDLHGIGIDQPVQLLARFVQGDATLRAHYGGAPVISDQRNDLARHVISLPEPPVIGLDPVALLAEIGAEGLATGGDLERVVTNLSLLKSVIPDFPAASLGSVRPEAGQGIDFAGTDWTHVDALLAASHRAQSAGETNEAIAILERCLDVVPEHPAALERLAIVLGESGRLDAALGAWMRCIEAMPQSPRAQCFTGVTLLRLGRPGDALAHLRRAVELAPASAAARRALDQAQAAERNVAAAQVQADG